jgi:hypothetical protein
VFNLWIYQRRSACSARMQHGGSAAYNPAGMAENEGEQPVMFAIAVSEQRGGGEDNVLPFRAPQDTGQPRLRGTTNRRNRLKGRGKGPSSRD